MEDLDLEFDVLVGNYLVAAGTGKRGISQTEYVHLSPMQRMAEIQAAITGLGELKEKIKEELTRLRDDIKHKDAVYLEFSKVLPDGALGVDFRDVMEENKRLRDALRFYANSSFYDAGAIEQDRGQEARKALSKE